MLLRPQHHTCPPRKSAQTWLAPEAICFTPLSAMRCGVPKARASAEHLAALGPRARVRSRTDVEETAHRVASRVSTP